MNELQKHLEEAYRQLAAIPVRGDGVDVMASVREHLRRAYQLAQKHEEDKADQEEA